MSLSDGEVKGKFVTEQTQAETEGSVDVFTYAADQMRSGMGDAALVEDLIEKGIDPGDAEAVVSRLSLIRRSQINKQKQEAGSKNMLLGAVWCIGGAIVTAVTFSSASGGGQYVVAWGAIIFGAFQFFQGLSQYTD